MSSTRGKYVPPAIDEQSFNCPHCGTLAQQFWFSLHARQLEKDTVPRRVGENELADATFDHIEDEGDRERVKTWFGKMATGRPFFDADSNHTPHYFRNVSVSRCYNCSDLTLWINNGIAWPERGEAPFASPDLPEDLRTDYDEASTILTLSPRGAAALLRLAIQKLCKHLGEKGKNLDDDIASLVKKGLDPRVQKALDVVRVIGNNSVHPGQMDLRDDRATAEKLFGMINLIVDIMITQPKHLEEMFNSLPSGALKAIQERDKS